MSLAPDAAARAQVPDPRRPGDVIDLDDVRHPLEASRFALAVTASALVIGAAVLVLLVLGQQARIWLALLGVLLALVLFWATLQLWRVRLLGDAVWVSADTLPEVQDVVDEVRRRLDYQRRVDVVVVDKMSRVLSADSAPVVLTSFFGSRVLVLESQVLGNLAEPAQRPERVFLIATYFGALKARHAGWAPLLLALEASGLPTLVFLFIYPWYRATTFTGDRIAYACCGDLRVSLHAVYRVLVGPELAPHLRTPGLVEQALSVRRSRLLRIGQLVRPTPYAPTRYLDLLSFAERREPDTTTTYLAGVPAQGSGLHDALHDLQSRRPHPSLVPAATVVAAVLVLSSAVGGVVIGQQLDDEGPAQDDLASVSSPGAATGPEPEPPSEQPVLPAAPEGFGTPSEPFTVVAPWAFDVDNSQPDEFACWVQLVDDAGEVVVDHATREETEGYRIEQSGTFTVRMFAGDEGTCSAWYAGPDDSRWVPVPVG